MSAQSNNSAQMTELNRDLTEYETLEGIIEIRDPEINVREVIAQIRANLTQHSYLGVDLDSIQPQSGLDLETLSLDEKADHHLRMAMEYRDQVFVGDQLQPPGASLFSRIVYPLKRQLHQLVRFYVDLASGRQAAVNAELTEAIQALLERSRRDADRIAALEATIEQLVQPKTDA